MKNVLKSLLKPSDSIIDSFIDKRAFQPQVWKPNNWISKDQLDFYNTNGYLKVSNPIDAELLSDIEDVTMKYIEKGFNEPLADYLLSNGRVKDVINLDSCYRKLYEQESLQEAMTVLNATSELVQSFIFFKKPNETKHKNWHQDSVYWDTPSTMTAAFVSTTDCDENMGCIWVIPGSHKIGRIYHSIKKKENNWEDLVCDTSAFQKAVPVPTKKGDVLFCHGLTIHASFENKTDNYRINTGFHIRKL